MMSKCTITESSKGKPILQLNGYELIKAFQLIVCNYQPTSVPQEAVVKFNSYFERTWIIGNFRLEVWNHFRGDVRSNNICEGYNSRLARRAKRSHLNTYRLC